jgi:hypothetical protein
MTSSVSHELQQLPRLTGAAPYDEIVIAVIPRAILV